MVAALAAAAAAGPLPLPRPGLELMASGGQPWRPETAFDLSNVVDDRIAPGFAVGGTLEWKLAGPLALETGLRYVFDAVQRRYEFVDFLGSGLDVSGTYRQRFHRLGVPLRLRTRLPLLRGLSGEAGAEAQYLLAARQEEDSSPLLAYPLTSGAGAGRIARPVAQIFEGSAMGDDITDRFPRWNLAFGGGLGWDFPLGAVRGELRGRYQLGASDQTKSPYEKAYTRVAELGLAVRW